MTANFAFLGLLYSQPNYGYELKKAYDDLFGRDKPLAFGQVYATLTRMVRDQQVIVDGQEQKGGPERKRYAITSHGRHQLAEWLGQPEVALPGTQAALFVKVATAILVDASPNDFLDMQRTTHLARMRELTTTRRSGDLAQTLRADYALFHLEADLRWMDVTAARIEELKKEIRP